MCPRRFHFRLLRILLILLAGISSANAQETTTGATEDRTDGTEDRIVDGRPPLYTFKRAINPLTWVEWGTEPLFRSAENGFIKRGIQSRPTGPDNKVAGVRYGLDGIGAGSGFGPSVTFFHRDLFGKGIEVEVPLVYTYRRYQLYQANLAAPIIKQHFVDRLSFDVITEYRSRARDDMFLTGNDSPIGFESKIRTVTRGVALGFSARINNTWKAGLHETYRNVGVTAPSDNTSAQGRFASFGIPGLATGGVLRGTALTVDHDTKDQPHMAATGGVEHLEISLNESIRKGDFAYWKYHFDFQHFFPLTTDHRTVLAFRGLAETNRRKGGSQVPWFDMPMLGSWETLRGFENFRFRDASAVAYSAEYRYRIWRQMDWGFFVDQGQVAPQPGDFSWHAFHTGYGFRVFFLPKLTFPVAIDVAHSNEKWRMYVNINADF
jgi:outer membrane protein assembly factor BamA